MNYTDVELKNIEYAADATLKVLTGMETYQSVKPWLDMLNVRVPNRAKADIVKLVQAKAPGQKVGDIAMTVGYILTGRIYTRPSEEFPQAQLPGNAFLPSLPDDKANDKANDKGLPIWVWAAIGIGGFLLFSMMQKGG